MSEVQVGQHYPLDHNRLPASWTVGYVGEFVEDVRSGFASGEHNQRGKGLPHLRPMNIDRLGRLDLEVLKFVEPSVGEARVTKGDVLFNNTNSPELVGKTAYITADRALGFSNHMTRLRVGSEIFARFIATQLHYLWMVGYFRHKCVNHVNQASISSRALAATVPLVVPPLREQVRIVECIEQHLSDIDAGVAATERALANLKRYRASVLKAACEGRLVPTEAELSQKEKRDYEPAEVLLRRILKERRAHWEEAELAKMTAAGNPPKNHTWRRKYEEPAAPDTSGLPELPEGWCWATVLQLCQSVTDGDHLPPPQTKQGVPFLVIGDVRDGRIDFANTRFVSRDYYDSLDATRRPQAGDVLYTVTGSFGIAVLVRGEEPFCVQRHIAILRPVSATNTPFVYHMLNTPNVFEQATKCATGTAQKTVPLKGLRQIVIPLPPQVEQSRVVLALESQLSLASRTEQALRAQLVRAAQLRKAVLKRAFEGKLVPHVVGSNHGQAYETRR